MTRTIFPYLIIVLLLFSCNSDQKVGSVTEDSISPIINSLGDTVITGLPVPAKGKVIEPGSVAKPTAIPAGKPRVVPAHLNVRMIPDDLKIKPVHIIDLLKTPTPGAESSSFVLVNSTGDTLPTGVPVPAQGKAVPCMHPQPVPTLPPGMKDNASMDIKYLDVYHGISSQVLSMTEDSHGHLWFGTTTGGASRYDGNTLSHFTRKEGLSGSWISCILEDSHGNLWFGTLGEGAIMFDGETFTHFTEKEGLSNNTVVSILEDNHGNLWFGTAGGGVSMYNGHTFTHFTVNEGLSNNRVLSILEDSHGNLWFGTENGVNMYDGQTIWYYTVDRNSRAHTVNSILEDGDGDLWFGTEREGVIRYNGETFTFLTENEGLSTNNVQSVLEDNQGNLWFGTMFGGVCVLKGNTITRITEEEGLSGNWVIPILEDSHGNLWFGTIGGGVSIYNSHSFKHITDKEGLSSRAVYSILEDSQGHLWFGTMFGGVCMYNGQSYIHFTGNEGLGSYTIESILEDTHGNLWFGTGDGGLIMYNGKTFTHFTEKEGFCNHSVGSILEDRNGSLWFGTYGGGVIRLSGETFTHFTENEGLSNNLVESLLEDSHGNLWVGTLGGGVSLYDGETFTHFTKKEGLNSNFIGCMLEDSHGNRWVGTLENGVSMYDGRSFTHFTENEGLNDNRVLSILEDSSGNIWLSTEQGLNLIRFEPENASVQIHSFGLQDGLKGMTFLQNSVFLDSKNRIWWGSNKSLTMLEMNDFTIDSKPLALHFNRIDINGQFLDYRHLDSGKGTGLKFDSVARFYNYPLNLELPYSQNHLTFHYSAIDWSAPHKLKYSYRMQDLRGDWSMPAPETKAEYRNLPYGTHTFEVRAIGEAQIWSEPFAYTFTIKPPWWHTWWARAGYGITALLIVFGVVQWRTSRFKQRQKELEKTVKERTVEISEKNEELKQQNEDLASQRDEIQVQKKTITESIEYARKIQTAILPPDEVLQTLLPKHFVFHKPLEIVSGDFYWLTQHRGKIFIAVADCTGHGVPGAFMSMLGVTLLNDIVNSIDTIQASSILNELRDQVIESLHQTGRADEAREGMDIGLCVVDRDRMTLQYAGAHHPLYLIRKGELTVIKADMMPIGISPEAGESFTNHEMTLQQDDAIYLFSDGYVDQFGGDRRKRFMATRLKQLLLDIQDKMMSDQKKILEKTLSEWMGLTGQYQQAYEQIDDIIVLGIKL